jgi:diaminopimelate epimerase
VVSGLINVEKFSGLGNDFLVVAHLDVARHECSRLARQWCNSETGLGADGLLVLGRDDLGRLSMRLYNADGSLAEMSGNGVRCLVHAATMRYDIFGDHTFEVITDAGVRQVEVRGAGGSELMSSVDMGPVTTIAEPENWSTLECDAARPVAHLSVGNPHGVVGVDDVRAVPLRELGQRVPQINLEVVEPGPETNAITMRVHERGVGITQACGTGACASAWAAVSWGIVAPVEGKVVVHMEGGDVEVQLHTPVHGHVTLTGPSVFVSRHSVKP